MTLDKHTIQGIPKITSKTLASPDFEELMVNANYTKTGSAQAKGNRVKVWWSHADFYRVESIYSPDMKIVITAYHVEYS